MNTEVKITECLKEMGTPAHLKGYQFIIDAVSICVENPVCTRGIALTGGLYDLVAKKNCSTVSKVEKGIRHAIEVTFDRIPSEVLIKYFGNSLKYKSKPTNLEFICTLVRKINVEFRKN